MNDKHSKRSRRAQQALLTLAVAGTVAGGAMASPAEPEPAPQRTLAGAAQSAAPGGFYCNIKALNARERARHSELTKKLVARRQNIVETDKGYELQYRPQDVSIAELAEWATMESKCCPFFDFHIDLENRGTLVCLRLTGRDGVKAFIASEFDLSTGASSTPPAK